MSNVFKTTSEVAHIWANQLQSGARYTGGNFFFEGDTIYSYGHHFPIARHAINAKGEKAVLFTERTYSNTTAKHVWLVKHACNHLNIIYCYDPMGRSESNFSHWLQEAELYARRLAAARKPEKYLSELSVINGRVIKYSEFIGVPIPETLAAVLAIGDTAAYTEYVNKKAAHELAEAKRKAKAAKKQHAEALKKWLRGEGSVLHFRDGRDYLRLFTSKTIETSQGVKIPFEYAKKLWTKVKDGKLKAGDKVLDFDVLEVGKDIKIGCHYFPTNYLIEFGNRIFQ